MDISIEQIKALRQETGAGIMDCKEALQLSDGDHEKAVIFLREKGLAKAAKRADRETTEGVVELYSHGDGRLGVMVEVNCETDFVSRSDDFRNFAHEIALQIASDAPLWVGEEDIPEEVLESERENARAWALEEGKPEKIVERIVEGRLKKYLDETCLLRQVYIRDEELKVQDLLNEHIASIGENIIIRRFKRWELGESTN
jgi:elongation factor Ts